MSSGPNKVFDDFAKLMTDAAGAAQGLRKEAESVFQAQADRALAALDVVQREEFDAVKEMAAKARDENEKLQAQITALETRLKALESK